MQRDKIVDEINRLYAIGLNSNDNHLKELLEELEKIDVVEEKHAKLGEV